MTKNAITQYKYDKTIQQPNFRCIIDSSARLSAVQMQVTNNYLKDKRLW
jgi:hypothetical protein